MARYKHIDTSPRLLPVDLTRQLLPGTFEHALNHLLDHEIDLSCFDARFCNDETGATAYPPAMLLKVVLFAYSQGIVSSRGIERAKITYEIAPDFGHWGVEIVGRVKAWAKAIIGPTSPPGKYPQLMNAPGSETGPGPQLVTWGKSTILSVDAHGFKFEYTLNSAKHIPFDWVGP